MQRAFAAVPRVLLVAAALQLCGCIAPIYRATFGPDPALDPELQAGRTENLYRVWHAGAPPPQPMRAEAGNVWPGAPDPVPTSLDLLKQEQQTGQPAAPVRAALLRVHRGGFGMCRPAEAPKDTSAPRQPAAPGVALGLCLAGG